jgi:hypothetical protein
MYILTGDPAWKPVPLDTASGVRNTHFANRPDRGSRIPDRVVVCFDCRISALFGVNPNGSASSPVPDNFIVKSGPLISSAVAACCVFGATDTAAGTPFTKNTDPPCGTPPAGIFGFA